MVWYNDELAYIEFQSTPSLRRATQSTLQEAEATPISIHALLAEGDGMWSTGASAHLRISIHALLAEGDVLRS